MEALSRREEEEVEAKVKTEALKACDELVREFADCARGRTVTIPFMCGAPHKAMNACIKVHMTEERLDAAKLDYISNRSERGREAVEKLYRERQEKLLRMSGRKENNPNFPGGERQV
ncbi:hypothetical protein CC85DRAFT_285865 [Cutaneotrichosporon oleaginosum]|uniref:COX assembly mitochondrial protein n=1 Tax=Cutaneotrichosporon oleaginosum TaxID=879819 RepID=A0A0J0XLW9_9TREE|nr:uncharacterized protein CC85DRAFT_285865 [Cutaneotrichosporon oleaginosum]KLT42097.1 hypothetical protein CC85DRAFT_285865 [Cutaneotrichosporon oleaginosum]TXT04664.1 hypothetical protein COLE_07483 [Cutaneotrichosporon oleaginosum]